MPTASLSGRPGPSRWPLIRLVLLAGLALGVGGCQSGLVPALPAAPVATPKNNVSLRIGKAIRADLTGVLAYSGDVQAKGEIGVIPRVTAQLEKVYVDVGARVRAGETLADLSRADFETGVLEAQAAQAAAEARLAQVKATARPEAVAQAQANLKAAQARLKSVENARQGPDLAALQKQADDARARVAQLQTAVASASQLTPAQADVALAQARTRLNALLTDPQRANDKPAIDAARQDISKAEEAAQAARQGTTAAAALDDARRESAAADQSLFAARLSPTAFDLDQARALVEAADAQVKLVSAPASLDEIKAAEAEADRAAALAELARRRLADTTVVAPVAGVVTALRSQPGDTVGPTGALLTLIPPELQVAVQADESQAAQVAVGQSVNLSVESLPQDSFAGTVKAVAPVLDPRTRMVAVKVEVPDPQGKLRPGMFVQLTIQTAERKAAVLVPREAVVRLPGPEASTAPQASVFLVVDNRVKRQRVLLGPSDARNVEILQGLTEGTDVILGPSTDLIDGELVVSAP